MSINHVVGWLARFQKVENGAHEGCLKVREGRGLGTEAHAMHGGAWFAIDAKVPG